VKRREGMKGRDAHRKRAVMHRWKGCVPSHSARTLLNRRFLMRAGACASVLLVPLEKTHTSARSPLVVDAACCASAGLAANRGPTRESTSGCAKSPRHDRARPHGGSRLTQEALRHTQCSRFGPASRERSSVDGPLPCAPNPDIELQTAPSTQSRLVTGCTGQPDQRRNGPVLIAEPLTLGWFNMVVTGVSNRPV